MNKIAVDIVLLPDDEVMDKAINANRELLRQYPDKIGLNKENCLPHISLAMGCIDRIRIPDIEKILHGITEIHPVRQLKFIGLYSEENSAGELVTIAGIERDTALGLLHEEIMEKLSGYFSYDVTPDMLISDDNITDSTLSWIQNYRVKSSFESFSPHITLGYGSLKGYSFNEQFSVSGLALCHLDNHCTCRKILAYVPMKK